MKQYTPEELNKLSKEEIVALLMQSQKEAALFKERLEELQMHLFGRSTERMECLVRTPLCKISSTGEIEQRFRLN